MSQELKDYDIMDIEAMDDLKSPQRVESLSLESTSRARWTPFSQPRTPRLRG